MMLVVLGTPEAADVGMLCTLGKMWGMGLSVAINFDCIYGGF